MLQDYLSKELSLLLASYLPLNQALSLVPNRFQRELVKIYYNDYSSYNTLFQLNRSDLITVLLNCNLGNIILTGDKLSLVSESIANSDKLSNLRLIINEYFDQESFDSLVQALTVNQSIRYLVLKFCRIKCGIQFAPTKLYQSMKQLIYLDLSHMICMNNTIPELVDTFKDSKTLKTLNLRHLNLYQEDTEMICRMIEVNQSITELDLSSNRMNGSIMIPLTKLTKTSFSRVFFDGKIAVEFKEFKESMFIDFKQVFANPNLTYLDLSLNTVFRLPHLWTLFRSFSEIRNITYLNLWGSIDLKWGNMNHLVEFLKTNTSLKTLNLDETYIEDASPIFEVMHKNQILTSLYLSDSGILNLDILISMLETNKTLRCLGLDRCNLGECGLQRLAQNMSKNKSLSKLLISRNSAPADNPFFDNAYILPLFLQGGLKELNYSSNEIRSHETKITETKVENLDLSYCFLTELIAPIQSLRKLDLASNIFPALNAESMIKFIIESKNLTELNLRDNKFDFGFIQELIDGLASLDRKLMLNLSYMLKYNEFKKIQNSNENIELIMVPKLESPQYLGD